jgi:hypothetical protein
MHEHTRLHTDLRFTTATVRSGRSRWEYVAEAGNGLTFSGIGAFINSGHRRIGGRDGARASRYHPGPGGGHSGRDRRSEWPVAATQSVFEAVYSRSFHC